MKEQISTKEREDNKIRIFFNKKELRELGVRTKIPKYKNFIKDINTAIVNEIILENEEGFLLPNRLGQISLKLTKKLNGAKLKSMSRFNSHIGLREYNSHTFGDIYYVSWNKESFSHYHMCFHHKYNYPKYDKVPLLYLKVFNFSIHKHIAEKIKFKILNQDLTYSYNA